MQLQEEAAREWADAEHLPGVRARTLLRSRHQHPGRHLVSPKAPAAVCADGQSAALRAGGLQRRSRQRAQVETGRRGDEQRRVHRANRLSRHPGLCEVSDAPLRPLSAAVPPLAAQSPDPGGRASLRALISRGRLGSRGRSPSRLGQSREISFSVRSNCCRRASRSASEASRGTRTGLPSTISQREKGRGI